MKTRTILSLLVFVMMISAFGQKATIELTFTAENDGQYVPLDSIFIENLTQGVDTMLYTPDTVLVLDYITSISNNKVIGKNTFSVSQNYPNPFKGKTEVNLYLQETEHIIITVRDILGRELVQFVDELKRGNHSFAFYSSNEEYHLLTVTGKQTSQTIKMLNSNSTRTNSEECKIVYTGNMGNNIGYKSQKAMNGFLFNIGDELLYIGYTGTLQSSILNAPETNETYAFQFASNIPCPETPTVEYEGQIYNTIQVFNQCWLKENLNVGMMIPGEEGQGNNDTIEKYCYEDEENNCTIYGGLYERTEMLNYNSQPGTQGICPQGWHIPTHEEWKVLEGAVDSQYDIGDSIWDLTGYRGFDAGLNLKSTNGWNTNGNGTDAFGFLGLPGGNIIKTLMGGINYGHIGNNGCWWTSSQSGYPSFYARHLSYDSQGSDWVIYEYVVYAGLSIRCLRD